MKLKDIESKIEESGESSSVELKKSTASLKAAAQTLCAFLNGQGGTVFIGVSDGGKVIGQVVTNKTKLDISNALKKFEPTANIKIEYVKVSNDKHVIAMTAHPDSRCVPYSFSGCAYERQQADTNVMSQTRYQQLLLVRNVTPVSWENQIAHSFSINDLDEEEITNTIKTGIKKNHIDPSMEGKSIEDILLKLGLVKNNQLINAAVVLFAKNPGSEYIQCAIRMARFKGLEKGNFIDSKQAFGHAFFILNEAENFIRRNTATAGKIVDGQMQRIDTPEYPFDAVREALVNALCHRDYASPGGAITLTIYDNRVEIINTGLLPDGITIDQLKKSHSSHPRNPNITKVFYRRGLIEEMGMGTQKMVKIFTNEKMKEPEFYEEAGTFVVRLWSRGYTDYSKDLDLSARQANILQLLQKQPLSPKEILPLLDEQISDRTLRTDLQTLKQKGYADSKGQGKQTQWFVIGNAEITRK